MFRSSHVALSPASLFVCLQLSYYGLSFSSYRHVAWFEREHSTGFITALAWSVTLTCTIAIPAGVWWLLRTQQIMLLEQDDSSLGLARVKMFTFTFAALLDGPLRPTQRRWALWILLKRNALSAAIGVLAVNTVQSESQWGMEAVTATSLQLATSLAIMILYLAFLWWSAPYASSTVNRLQLVYELLSCSMLVMLLSYHARSGSPFIDLVLILNLAAAIVSVAIFAVMVWEVSRPYHTRIVGCFGRSETTAAATKRSDSTVESTEPGADAAVVTPLAQQLFPDLDGVLPTAEAEYSPSHPPPLPVKRRPRVVPVAVTATPEFDADKQNLRESLLS
jgi:hypothetical protein